MVYTSGWNWRTFGWQNLRVLCGCARGSGRAGCTAGCGGIGVAGGGRTVGSGVPVDVDKLALAHPPQGQNGQRNEGNEDEAQGAIGVNGPAQQQAEPAKVSVAESGIRGAEGTKDTEEECRQESNDEAVDKSTERGTTAAAGGIAINACCTAGEEVRHQTGQNQRNAKGWICLLYTSDAADE